MWYLFGPRDIYELITWTTLSVQTIIFYKPFKFLSTMKKLLFGLLATVMLVCSANAQTKLSTAKKAAIDAQMITLVHLTAQTTYKSGMSQADFIKQTESTQPKKKRRCCKAIQICLDWNLGL
jgi:hypothetical protein